MMSAAMSRSRVACDWAAGYNTDMHPLRRPHQLRPAPRLRRTIDAVATRPLLAAILLTVFVVGVRLAVLPWNPVPTPLTMDEFAMLLQADTFASGRLTNPTHPLWSHFETFYVIHQPSYNAKYPPGQALLLAFGQIVFGHPWPAILISVAAMVVAILWMLRAWAPPIWAFTGAFLAAAQISIHHYWLNSYWGGSLAAIGGALVMGALPRIVRRPTVREAALFGTGLGILALTRTFEGLAFSLVPCGVLVGWFLRDRTVSATRKAVHVILPIAATVSLFVGFYLIYNFHVTGHPLHLPYTEHVAQYEPAPHFVWQSVGEIPDYRHEKLKALYVSHAQRGYGTPGTVLRRIGDVAKLPRWDRSALHPRLLFGYALGILFLAGGFLAVRHHRLRIPALSWTCVLAASLVSTWYFDHYVAPAESVFYLLVAWAVRYLILGLRRWRISRSAAANAVCLASAATVLLYCAVLPVLPIVGISDIRVQRPRITADLERHLGKHLVLVRYTRDYALDADEWVYNAADIDASRIVWARDMGEAQNQRLLSYYPDRHVWLLERDGWSAQLFRITD